MEAALTKVDKTFDRLQAALKRSRQQAKESTARAFTESRQALQDGRTHLFQGRGAVTTHRTVAERGKSMPPTGGMGQMAVAMKKCVADIVNSTLLPENVKVIKTVTTEISSEAVSHVEKALAEVAQVKVIKRATTAISSEAVSSVEAQARVKVTGAELAELMTHVAASGYFSTPLPSRRLASGNFGPRVLNQGDGGRLEGAVFQFHKKCGRHIALSNNQKTAERRQSGRDGGIVVTRQPMKPSRLYEVHVDEIGSLTGWDMLVGATSADPNNTTTTFPSYAWGWTSAVVFSWGYLSVHGAEKRSNVGDKLGDQPKGSRVGVMLDDRQRLHLYINGEHQGQAGTTVSQPCFALFDVRGPYRKITALPLRKV
ncbi:neuralized-like protein 4 [Babylonia areolata]|uniref:neuralized-like protein 4 n=1 Tax=Babylonia areolata TaxID=304850 RepID=UPI003FD18C41